MYLLQKWSLTHSGPSTTKESPFAAGSAVWCPRPFVPRPHVPQFNKMDTETRSAMFPGPCLPRLRDPMSPGSKILCSQGPMFSSSMVLCSQGPMSPSSRILYSQVLGSYVQSYRVLCSKGPAFPNSRVQYSLDPMFPRPHVP